MQAEIPLECWCRNCNQHRKVKIDLGDGNFFNFPYLGTRMVVCPICGNKRCPHATDHELECTNSNEPGQKGSAYE